MTVRDKTGTAGRGTPRNPPPPAAPPPPVGISAGVLFWGNNSVAATTATRYLEPGFEGGIAPLIGGIAQMRAPFTGTLRNLFIRHNGTAGNGNPIVYTVRVQNVATVISVSLASTAANGSDIVNTAAVTQGNLIDIEVTKAAGVGTSPARTEATLEYTE